MTITYSLSAEEVHTFDVHVWRPYKRSALRRFLMFALGSPFALLIAFLLGRSRSDQQITPAMVYPYVILVAVVIVVVFGGWAAFAWWNLLPSNYTEEALEQRNPAVLSQRTATLSPGGITLTDLTGTGKIHWDAIRTIESTDREIFLDFQNGTSLMVPKRVFNAPEEAETFYQVVRDYWQAAKSLSA